MPTSERKTIEIEGNLRIILQDESFNPEDLKKRNITILCYKNGEALRSKDKVMTWEEILTHENTIISARGCIYSHTSGAPMV